MALGPVGRAVVEKVRWRSAGIKAESVERICWHMAQRIVLHDQVAEAVKDWLATVHLDAHQDMRAVRRKDIGTGIDATVGEVVDEIGLFDNLGALFAVNQLRPIKS